MFVCVSTECFPDLPLAKARERLAELEFTAVEIDVHEGGPHLQPGGVAADPEAAIAACSRRTLSPPSRLTCRCSSCVCTLSLSPPPAVAMAGEGEGWECFFDAAVGFFGGVIFFAFCPCSALPPRHAGSVQKIRGTRLHYT